MTSQCLLPLVASDSSSNLPSIVSALLPIVAIEEAVLRRAPLINGNGGETTVSLADVFRDSHAKGLVIFLPKGVGGGYVGV